MPDVDKTHQLVDKTHYQELLKKCAKLEKEVQTLKIQKVILNNIIGIKGLLLSRINKIYYASAS